MKLTQYLLCALVFCLGSLRFSLAMAEETDASVFMAAPGKDLTTVSYLDLTSADALGTDEEIAGRSAVELSLVAEGFREELNNSQSQPSWNAGVREEPGLTSGLSANANSSSSLLPSSLLPIPVTGEANTIDSFTSSPQAWVSPATESRLSGRVEEQAVPATSPTSAVFMRPSLVPVSPHGDTVGGLDDLSPTTASDSGNRRDGLNSPSPGISAADVPAGALDSPTIIPASYSSLSPPQLFPDNTGLARAVAPLATATAGNNAVSSQGPSITGRNGEDFTLLDPDHTTLLEATSKMEEQRFIPDDSSGTKPTTAREELQETTQVVCRDWSKLAGKSYVILNLTENTECEAFRFHKGLRLLKIVAESFSRKLSPPADSWLISLSKPSEDDKHLLMMLASDRGTIPAKEVLAMLGDMKENLKEIGIHNVTSATGCQGRPSQPRGDYGKLFIVLVIIGSICAVIIVSGLVYICWQRRLPKLKNMSHGEELHFVENGCHDNPTLDITIDSTSEMQEKKPSVNGDAMERSGGWNALITKGSKDEPDNFEEDTHL
ncbi:podocalyxin-like protein 2 isoform X2 [Heterodontus francisci]|uniref:podocalyxin-like protein 2 isoform X2 n=1 Tax=Heterodontus francisci TaxID=7792 RepID=UPI00355C54C4